MSSRDRSRWDEKWRETGAPPAPAQLLVDHCYLFNGGVGLDVACGLGQNTIFLAQQGLSALGVDLSAVALRRAAALAGARTLEQPTYFVQVDLDHWRPAFQSVDLICVFRFLDRDLLPALRRALRPGGHFFYQTRHSGLLLRQPAANTSFLLQRGELPDLFRGWNIVTFEEGSEDAAIVVRKPLADGV